MSKIEGKIMGILNENTVLNASEIKEKLGLTYDTIAKYLKNMTNRGILERTAKGSPWTYYYQLQTTRSER